MNFGDITHGFARPRRRHYLYQSWAYAVQVCRNRNHRDWRNYGKRGICVYGPWQSDAARFITDILDALGERPTDRHVLGRIDKDDDFRPGNLQWFTRKEQRVNSPRRDAPETCAKQAATLRAWWTPEKRAEASPAKSRAASIGWTAERRAAQIDRNRRMWTPERRAALAERNRRRAAARRSQGAA